MSCPQIRALLDVEVKPTAKLVLLALALRAGQDGRAWPSIGRLCVDTGLSERAVRYAIQTLAEAGHIGVEHRPGRSLWITVSAAPHAGVARHVVPVPRHVVPVTAAPHAGRSKKEVDKQEVATTDSTAQRPVVANGKGPAAGESWGEYRERGGR